MTSPAQNLCGAVVIGRNEGERLRTCLQSVAALHPRAVYVDSGSTDNSIAIARELGVETVNLDMSTPFTAARARNAGFRCLTKRWPDVQFVQFVDGDCELMAYWIAAGLAFLKRHERVAIVSGRIRERFPAASTYNRLCDFEWDTPIGETTASGGVFLARVDAFRACNGFRPDMIGGEEPELCLRLRRHGWKIWRLDVDMAWHDANITRFRQWWTRSRRAGHAYAEGFWLHGLSEERFWARELARALGWGLFLPILTLMASVQQPLMLSLLAIYPAQVVRIVQHSGRTWGYAFYIMLGKFPEATGAMQFFGRKLSGRSRTLIEYKG